jgi:hypothetical protein
MELEITLKITSTNVVGKGRDYLSMRQNMSNAPALVGELGQERGLHAIQPMAASSTFASGSDRL